MIVPVLKNHLEGKQVNGKASFVRWSNNPQSKVDNGHVATFCVFAVFTDTFCHVDQSHGSKHG